MDDIHGDLDVHQPVYVAKVNGVRRASIPIGNGFLAGDVNRSRIVAVSDVVLVNAQIARPVNAANFLKDVDATGTLTVETKSSLTPT